MKINKNDFAPIEQIENDMVSIQEDAMKIAQTALLDGLQHEFDKADEKDLSDREYLKEIISSACGISLSASSLYTGHIASNYVPLIVELAYQNAVQRIESNFE